MKKQVLLLISISFIFCSCAKKETTNYLKIIEDGYMADSSIIDYNDESSYQLIPLENNENVMYSSINKVIINDHYIAINNDDQEIITYHINGDFIAKIDKRGHGNGEYIKIGDIIFKGDTIAVSDRNQEKILNYSINGDFLYAEKLAAWFGSSFEKLSDENYIWFMYSGGMTPENGEIIISDKKGNMVKELITMKEDYGDRRRFGPNKYFAKSNGKVYFIPIFEDKIYSIDKDLNLETVLDFNMKSKMVGYEDVTDAPVVTIDKYGYFSDLCITDNGTFTVSTFKKNKPISAIGNLNTGEFRLTISSPYSEYKNYFVSSTRIKYTSFEGNLKGKHKDAERAVILFDSNKIKYN